MSDNLTRCFDRECLRRDECKRFAPEFEKGMTFYLHNRRLILQDWCDDFIPKEA